MNTLAYTTVSSVTDAVKLMQKLELDTDVTAEHDWDTQITTYRFLDNSRIEIDWVGIEVTVK